MSSKCPQDPAAKGDQTTTSLKAEGGGPREHREANAGMNKRGPVYQQPLPALARYLWDVWFCLSKTVLHFLFCLAFSGTAPPKQEGRYPAMRDPFSTSWYTSFCHSGEEHYVSPSTPSPSRLAETQQGERQVGTS